MDKLNLTESLKKLEEINTWFENQEEVDVEKGLEKVKEGAKLVKASRERLQEIENEFEEVRKELVQNEIEVQQKTGPNTNEQEINLDEIPF